jgi:glucose dehydrogenase
VVEDGTDINAQALNLISTGTITGSVKVISVTTGLTVGTSPATVGTDRVVYGGAIFVTTGTATIVLPAVASGMSICVVGLTASATVINPDDNDIIYLNGTALSAGDSITSASTSGDYACLLGINTNNWVSMGRSGDWTDTN